ncbi:hypothetical protein B1C78_06395 [Thioalkalivibrio denitrificans]|uniref:Thymidine phosphorylase n=1 Tax=Thioalkalivibrio denitrificans TaxID=108003 RepID=A0A1V3NKK8_9GAMM|nr:DUF1631 domain-containing protein [Thioalkalivibrio denitrificans]OOG25590.1 hypothetical protein B1C78_06395 [Thioalkalivibrio denitrificans]
MNDPVSENVVPFSGAPRRESAGSALQIVGRCRNVTTAHVQRCLKEMLDNTDDALFKLAEQAEDNRSQSEYFDAMREVRRRRSTIESEYPMQISRVFDEFLRSGPARSARSAAAEMELSLVEDDELEENLAMEGMISKANRINESEIYALTRRLAVALDRPKLAEDAHPLSPSALCEAFRSAMKVLDVNLQVRLIIYKLFDKYVVGELHGLYHELNHELAEMGVLPELRTRSTVVPGQGGRRGARSDGESTVLPDGDEAGDGNELLTLLQHLSGQGGVPLPPGVNLVDRSLVSGALGRIPAVVPAGGIYSGAQLKDAVLAAVNGGDSTGVALNRMDETAIDIVAMLFDFIFEDPALPAPIKELIGRLQIPVLRVAIADRGFFNRKKHPARRLLNELTRAGIGWTEAEEREDGLRTRIGSMVDRLLENFDGDVSIFEQELEAFLEWSHEQAERAAQREEHSALAAQGREHLRVAKAVAEEAISRVVEEQQLPEVVDNLLRTTWKDLLVLIYLKDGQHGKLWQKALNVASLLVWSLLPKPTAAEREQLTDLLPSLLRALQEGMTRMSCTQEEQDGIFAVLSGEHARLVRDPEMNLDVDVPRDVRTDAPEAGSDAAVVDEVMEPTADVVLSAEPDPDPVSAPSMSEVDTEEVQDGKSFMARKVAEINQLISEGRFKVYDEVVVGDGAIEDAEDLHLLTARELEEGTWLELRDEDGNPSRVKLSWKSLISGKYFFVNRQGLKVRELTVPALATEFREGRARLIEDVPVFDRAISTLMASLSSSAK